MRVHSLYLSTLSGTNPTVFTATITGNLMTVTAIISGPMVVGQTFFSNGKMNTIFQFQSGTIGGVGVYITSLNFSAPIATTYTAYTPDPALKYAPTIKQNLNQVTWNVNWREIFGDRKGECRVRVRLASNTSGFLTNWNMNTGSLRASLSSSTTNMSNGLNVGPLQLESDFTSGSSITAYISCDTISTSGITMTIPSSNSDFTLTLLNTSEAPMLFVPEYQVWLYFDVDDE